MPTSCHSHPLESSYYIKIGDLIHFQKLIKALHAFIIHHQPPLCQKVKNSCKLNKCFLLGHNPSDINHLVNHIYMPSSVIYVGMFRMLTLKTSVPFSNFLLKLRTYIFVSYYVCETHLVWESKTSSHAFNFHAYFAPCMVHLNFKSSPTKSSTHGNLIAQVFWKCLSISHSTFLFLNG